MSVTKFLKFINLSRINDSKDFLGISPGGSNGSVIITLSRNIVIVVKISTQQQICSWSTQEKLSSKVIFDNSSNKYVGIFGNRYIRCWDASVTDINSIKKFKLQKYVVDIIPSKDEPIILYSDGYWDRLSKALSLLRESHSIPDSSETAHQKCGNIKDANTNFCIDGEQVLTYFVPSGDSKEIELVIMPLKSGGKRKSLKIGRKDITASLSGYAIVEGENNCVLLTIWSDRRLFLLNLDECMESEHSPGNFVAVISTLNVDSPLSILGIAKNCVAIYGANNNQEGASLLLYNTQFKVVKAQQYFKVFFDSSRIWIIDDNILLAMGQNLSVVTYRMPQELLVDLLGTYHCENPIRIEGDLINEEDYLQSICSYKENVSPVNTSNYESLTNIQDYRNHLPTSHDTSYNYYDLREKSKPFIKVDQGKCFLNNTITVQESKLETDLINRTLFEFFIHQLENYGTTKEEVSEKLLFLLEKCGATSKMTSLLSRLSSAPLSVFAKVFFSILMKRSSNSTYESFTAAMLRACCLETGIQPLQAAKINNFRSDLSSFDLIFLLDYFYNQLSQLSTSSSEICNMKLEMRIFYWFDILLNAYFQQLLLSKDNKVFELLLKWADLISSYRNQIKMLEDLETRLYNLVQKEYFVENSNSFLWYSIEDLCF
ncbi:uncharacterized protein LOC126761881 [Bactrocera neohumeralis]|uniref:uncharacterized protein LOC126761881 n=1 Tax=Bactrocera neohumeralis TaxID=98809 RepID=UPI00216671C0|nr:uncharacterized protein LOC126761881 [Bactrocera neohumeralis]